ncbi:phenazine biosynthesis-like domain-containing protein [Siphateles boraxobius]|uniref:phenazine biosynthesis-like domain-containing protein n=1 Tax=Siphateles boraxobius TaxID=180520 RepID=UPI0040631C86
MEIPIFTVDAFTYVPFKGNPAAICLMENELQDDLYQSIAAEMNLSQTAFITRQNSMDFSSGILLLRCMLKLCEAGGALITVGSPTALSFSLTGCGEKASGASPVGFGMSVRESVLASGETNFYVHLQAAAGDLPIQDVCYCPTTWNRMIRLADTCDRSKLTSLRPEAEALLKNESTGKFKGVIVTIKGAPTAQPGYDFYSRYFAPWFGIPEDPVTGSAHTVLAGYWSEKLNKKKMLVYQCSHRGGELELELRDEGRLNISGRAQIIVQGTLKILLNLLFESLNSLMESCSFSFLIKSCKLMFFHLVGKYGQHFNKLRLGD